jgi:hypothetical protein
LVSALEFLLAQEPESIEKTKQQKECLSQKQGIRSGLGKLENNKQQLARQRRQHKLSLD